MSQPPGRLRGWPDPVYDDLLRAAAGPSSGAAAAWRRFVAAFDVDEVEGDSYRLLAAVAGNLPDGVDVPERGRLSGIARRTWFSNQRAYGHLAAAVGGLRSIGVEVLVAKGAALAVQSFPGVGHRPFADVDLYVRAADRDRAVDWFAAAGYAPKAWIPDPAGRRAVSMVRGPLHAGDVFDLHVLPPAALRRRDVPEASADELWDHRIPLRHGLVTTASLGPAEQLVVVLVHGIDVRSESPLRGFADAAWIVRRPGADLRWADVVSFANLRRVQLEVHSGLRYVHEVIGVGCRRRCSPGPATGAGRRRASTRSAGRAPAGSPRDAPDQPASRSAGSYAPRPIPAPPRSPTSPGSPPARSAVVSPEVSHPDPLCEGPAGTGHAPAAGAAPPAGSGYLGPSPGGSRRSRA